MAKFGITIYFCWQYIWNNIFNKVGLFLIFHFDKTQDGGPNGMESKVAGGWINLKFENGSEATLLSYDEDFTPIKF